MPAVLTLFAALLLSLLTVAPAEAVTRLVDDDRRQCAAPFTTIQSAVDAAAPGDRVLVCPGVYPEQVTIPGEKHSLQVISNTLRAAVVRSSVPFNVQANGVEIARFRIEGGGIGVTHAGSNPIGIAGIRDNLILRASVGIGIDDAGGGRIQGNTILDYDATGIELRTPSGLSLGASASILSNTLTGRPGSIGISVQQGPFGSNQQSHASIFGNRIANNTDAGIDIFNAIAEIKSNRIVDNGVGLRLRLTGGPLVETNVITNNRRQGILVEDSGGILFNANDARSNEMLDCEDRTGPGGSGTAGTMNTWTANRGLDASPPGICRP